MPFFTAADLADIKTKYLGTEYDDAATVFSRINDREYLPVLTTLSSILYANHTRMDNISVSDDHETELEEKFKELKLETNLVPAFIHLIQQECASIQVTQDGDALATTITIGNAGPTSVVANDGTSSVANQDLGKFTRF